MIFSLQNELIATPDNLAHPSHNWRAIVGVPALLGVLTALFMIAALRPPTGIEALDGHDLVNQQYPLLSLIFDSVRNGHGLPLWNPYLYAGQSIAANPQATFFYPPAWLMLPLGVPRAVTLLVALHLWIGGWGIACFMRRMGASWFGALCGAITYEFSALLGARIGAGHLNYVLCQAWLPWIAAAYLWAVAQRSLFAVLPGAAALGLCVLTGYPPLLYFGGLWLLVLWIYLVAQADKDRWQVARRALIRAVGIGGIGFLLGAALLLPTAQLTLRSTRTQQASLAFSNSYALPGGQLITLLFPNVFGYPTLPDQGYWGLPFYEESTAYVGILPLLAICFVRKRPAAVLLGAFVIVGVIISLGSEGGLFAALYWLLPGYSLFRVPSRALYFFVVGASGLIALAFTDLQNTSAEECSRLLRFTVNRLLPLLGAFALVASFALMMVYTTHSADPTPPWRALVSGDQVGLAVVAIGAAWLILRLWQSPGTVRRWLPALTMIVLLFDVWHIAWPMVTVSAVDVPDEWKLLARLAPAAPDFRVMTVPDQIVWQAGATYTRHLNASGYDPLVGSDYQALWQAVQDNPASPIAALLGVKYVISDAPPSSPKLPTMDHLTVVDHENGWYVYQTHDPLPHVFIVPNVTLLDSTAARQQIASGSADPRKVAFTDHAISCSVGDSPHPQPLALSRPSPKHGEGASQRRGESNAASITRYATDSVTVDTRGSGGLLVLTDSYDPDWVAAVDDHPASVVRVDSALRGVCVPGGDHQVRFDYQPRAFEIGILVSALSWIGIGLAGVWIGVRWAGRKALIPHQPLPPQVEGE